MPFTAQGRVARSQGAIRVCRASKEKNHGPHTHHHIGSHTYRSLPGMAAQQKLGILPQRRTWAYPFDRAHSDAYGKDLKPAWRPLQFGRQYST